MRVAVLVIGGNWDALGGRPSKFIATFAEKLQDHMGDMPVVCHNGGDIARLEPVLTYDEIQYQAIIWMPNIDNSYEKILPDIRDTIGNHPILIQSKNNLTGKYSAEELFTRTRDSRADALIEFVMAGEHLRARLLYAAGIVSFLSAQPWTEYYTSDGLAQIVARLITKELCIYHPPIKDEDRIFVPQDMMQAGKFAAVRRHHIHEGVDVYAKEGAPVHAMISGQVINIRPFTGEKAGHPHWNDTDCIMIYHDNQTGILNYGELVPIEGLAIGDEIAAGQIIGHVKRVLKNDKGRPTSMLHIERYVIDTVMPIPEWPLEVVQPRQLLDPSPILDRAYGGPQQWSI